MKTITWLILLAIALATLPAMADDSDFSSAQWKLLDTRRVMTAAAPITVRQYPDCDTVIVEQNSVRDYHVDGTGQTQDESFTKILTAKGKPRTGSYRSALSCRIQPSEVSTLEIIHPNGTTTVVNVAANSKVTIDTSQMAENIYDPNSQVFEHQHSTVR